MIENLDSPHFLLLGNCEKHTAAEQTDNSQLFRILSSLQRVDSMQTLSTGISEVRTSTISCLLKKKRKKKKTYLESTQLSRHFENMLNVKHYEKQK